MPPFVEPFAVPRSAAVDTPRPDKTGGYSVQILGGYADVFSAQAEISELRGLAGQAENPLLDLSFFLGRVRLFPANRPVVLLVRTGQTLEGAVYLYEKTFLGIPTGYLRGFDHLTGESSVIGREADRPSILQCALRELFAQTRARVAWATVSGVPGEGSPIYSQPHGHALVETSGLSRQHRLKLSETYGQTLSRFGQHTRRNLRYYRRRAEKELQASFHPEMSVADSDEALRQLGEPSFQPFRGSLAEWQRMDGLLRTQPGHFAMGLRANGQWISYLVGMRSARLTYALLQMNHSKFARYSLSTVLRSYFFEHEIERGQAEIKFVNGTCALFQRCCEPDTCLTMSARRGLSASFISNVIAPWHSAPDHALNMKRWTRRLQPASGHLPRGTPDWVAGQPKG